MWEDQNVLWWSKGGRIFWRSNGRGPIFLTKFLAPSTQLRGHGGQIFLGWSEWGKFISRGQKGRLKLFPRSKRGTKF